MVLKQDSLLLNLFLIGKAKYKNSYTYICLQKIFSMFYLSIPFTFF